MVYFGAFNFWLKLFVFFFFQFWDMGKGFALQDLYKTGWTVAAVAFVAALALAAV
jgi:hypothetical protein